MFGNQFPNLRGNISQRESRWCYAAFYTAVQQGNRLVDEGWQRAQSGDDVGVILDRSRRHRVNGRGGVLRALLLRELEEISRESRSFNRFLDTPLENIVAQLVRSVQSAPVDCPHNLKLTVHICSTPVDCGK